ncbi:hypothetical protein Tco_0002672 [Tanacetum coccineum]
MAALQYKDDHNKIAYLGRERGCEDFTDILSYLDHSPLRYALTHAPPVVFDSLVKQFWATAVVRPNAAGSHDLVATIDGREVVVTESLIRTQLHFDDANGIFDMPNSDILEGMRAIGYPTDRALTFLKNHLSPQWRFLVHTLMHCLSPKSGSWNQFPSSIATALLCLSTGRVYNFSRFILEGMIGNVKATKNKFLMYPRFLQMIVAIETADRTPRPTFGFTRKLFANMRFKWEGQPIPLTPPMLAIAAAGDDAAAEENVAAHEAAGSTVGGAPPEPYSPRFPLDTWPSVPAHSPVRDPTPEPASPPSPPAQTFIQTQGYVDPDFVEPIIFGPQPRPDNYLEPEDLDNLLSMEDDTTHGGFHVESPVRPNDASTPTADAAGRAEDPVLLTSLSAKLDRCMGRLDSLETELGTTKKIMGGAILTLVSRVKKLEKTVKQLRTTRLVGDVPAAEGDVDIQDDVDLDGLSRLASAALGHDQPAVPSADVEEREEEEVPLRRKRSAYRRARTEFSTPAFEQFQANLSADGLPHTAVSESAGPSVAADKGKAPMPDLDIPAEFLAEDAQARKRFRKLNKLRAKELDDLMMRMTETDWLNLMMQVGSNPALARELLGADVTEENFIERMTAVKERKKRALADLRYRALKGKPLRNLRSHSDSQLVKIHGVQSYGTITMEESSYEYKNSWIEGVEYISFSKRTKERVERASSQPASVPAVTTHTADDLDSAGGGGSHPAGSAFGAPVTDSTVTTPAAIDSAGSRREIGVSPFADSVASSSPSNVSSDHIPIDVLFESTSGGIHDFFLESDEEEQLGMSRVAPDPDSDDEVLAEILFRGQSISADGVVLVDKLPDDEIVDPRVKVETVSDYASSPPRNRRKHLGVRSDDCLWDKPVEDFSSSESESDDDMENYIPPLPYGEFKDWEMVSCPPGNSYIHIYYQQNRRRKYFRLNPDVNIGLDLWRDVNMLCQSLHSDDVEDFWRTQDEWIVSSWKLYPKSSVHVLDLTNGKTVYMFVDKFYPIRATLLERMLRHRLTVPPSYCRDVVVAGNIIQTVQTGLRQSYECLASAPIACTARQMVFSSPWLTAKKESGSPLQTALVCFSNPLIAGVVFTKVSLARVSSYLVSLSNLLCCCTNGISAACVAAAVSVVSMEKVAGKDRVVLKKRRSLKKLIQVEGRYYKKNAYCILISHSGTSGVKAAKKEKGKVGAQQQGIGQTLWGLPWRSTSNALGYSTFRCYPDLGVLHAKDKNGLGYGTQLDEMSNKSETDSEISMSVFEVRSSDEEITPANDRFSKADGYHVVPPPITGNFLTPRADISFAGLDEYAIRKKIIESKTTKLNTDTSKSKTSETVGKTNEVNIEKPKSVHESVVPKPKINRDKVIIEDWYSDDEDDVSEVNTVSPIKTNETQTIKTQVDKIGQISQKEGIGFKKIKACFICKSPDHLIKDCDFYAKESPEPKLKTVVHTGQTRVLTRTGFVNPVRPNGKRAVHTVSTAKPISTARPISTTRPVSTARPFAPKIAQTDSVIRPIYPRMDNGNQRSVYTSAVVYSVAIAI